MAGVTNESLDALLERKGVHAEIRQQVRDKGFANVIHFAGAIAEDELAEWFMHSTSLVPSDRDTDGRITNWNKAAQLTFGNTISNNSNSNSNNNNNNNNSNNKNNNNNNNNNNCLLYTSDAADE